jgi:acyl-CoA synthetase (AMP-forming)/AMP-acid ligase II
MNSRPPNLPDQLDSLVDLLQWRSAHHPHKLAYHFLKNGEADEISITYGELDRQAKAIATQLAAWQGQGKRALLLYPPGLDYIAAFFGCLYAGIVAIPAYPPRPNRSLGRLQSIISDANAQMALTVTPILASLENRLADYQALKDLNWIPTDQMADASSAVHWQNPGIEPNSLALLQYTSGSTANPKGVMITHGNLLHNSSLIQQCFEDTADSMGVSWLPPYHDMGLIGGILQPLYVGAPMVLMPPVAFLQKPFRWLQAISKYAATTSGGPNFAYDLCLRKTTPAQKESLDLSHWRLAFTGAEPVHYDTLKQFAEAFKVSGFRWQSFFPCYGLAESTLLVTGSRRLAPPITCSVTTQALADHQVMAPENDTDQYRTLVSCGKPPVGQCIEIVDPDTCHRCPPGKIGEIWVAQSPSIAQGYWNRSEETQQNFCAYLADTEEGPFLRTEDLGFMRDGELFVTGRIKEMIIIRGQNHYARDIELTVEQSHPALRPGCGAAFSIEVNGEERLVVVQEVERRYLRDLDVDAVVGDIRQALTAEHGLQVYATVLLKTGSIPKTSSGKIQRYACRTKFLEGTLDVLAEPVGKPSIRNKVIPVCAGEKLNVSP